MSKKKTAKKNELPKEKVFILKLHSGKHFSGFERIHFDNKNGTIYLKEQKKQEVEDGEKD